MRGPVKPFIALIAIMFAFVATGCVPFLTGTKADITAAPKTAFEIFDDKLHETIFWYNSIYADTMSQATNPDLTEEQKVIVRKKKELLQKAEDVIKTALRFTKLGQLPSTDDQQAVLDFLNELQGIGGSL